ncbi:hypothetical protein P168DRAFT_245435 [Aspergillus campestris IBT 28561]|uniref:Uncharacterized protein n=4 Tax=Aspergillus TaxID=5052 RepID=A0A2I2FQE0_9EURO|nr:uncharacterized protein P170DRAFT_371290 [Aspergillus steynii IBT 23096]PKX88177.1 hypothetical protein P174DRAFT_380986 [Aspergillus novofumigatus IBT 16806]PKX99714.1 hypothetical protein P168DRAFT_245653 [Aspergillus campestris IBT 28561]PTU16781.1 hypothetical protein P175DRAFT_0447774 [Aspergillus ochraceoroseus IBT 24754]PKX88281.1 hypothetical protein P174DRAFT_380724 [Aspergillus novofumigatus IBT 16806]PKX93497.1 hypothetical protein P174DRAFT_373241 [Aspergillus novofumigatus IBT 
MHHHPKDQERALNLSILILSGPGEFPRVELHALWCPSVNFFKFQPCDHTPPEPKNFDFS